MWSHLDLEKWLQWAKVAYMVSVGVAAAATFAIYHLSAWVTADKERELEKYQNESQIQIADAEAAAAKAMKIAESERLARAKLESQIAGAEERAAEANAVASKAQLELARLKKPRTIAPEDQDRIIAELTKFTGQNFSVSVFQDPEALALLRVLDAMLKSAGWIKVRFPIRTVTIKVAGITAAPSFASGVGATIGRDDRASVAAILALSEALSRAGIPCRRMLHAPELQDKTPNTILIYVGKKP